MRASEDPCKVVIPRTGTSQPHYLSSYGRLSWRTFHNCKKMTGLSAWTPTPGYQEYKRSSNPMLTTANFSSDKTDSTARAGSDYSPRRTRQCCKLKMSSWLASLSSLLSAAGLRGRECAKWSDRYRDKRISRLRPLDDNMVRQITTVQPSQQDPDRQAIVNSNLAPRHCTAMFKNLPRIHWVVTASTAEAAKSMRPSIWSMPSWT